MLVAFNINDLDWGGKGFAYALDQAHLPGLIVSAILLLLSVISWSVMFSKFALVSKSAQKNYKFVHGFRKAKSSMEPYEANFSIPGSPLYAVYKAGSREMAIHLLGAVDAVEARQSKLSAGEKISPEQMLAIRNSMDRAIGETVVTLESKMNFLATAVSGAPFLGLLGTVWGVMETFSGVASAGSSASIQTMAPGVAAALVTTVIGLLVAIPAMFGYNLLINRIRTLILEMHNFASELASLFERELVDYNKPVAAFGYGVEQQLDEEPQPAQPGSRLHTSSPGDSFLPTKRAGASGNDDGPPINPIAQQAAARRRQQTHPRPR